MVITWHPSLSSVSFYILILYFETTGLIGTKLGTNIHNQKEINKKDLLNSVK